METDTTKKTLNQINQEKQDKLKQIKIDGKNHFCKDNYYLSGRIFVKLIKLRRGKVITLPKYKLSKKIKIISKLGLIELKLNKNNRIKEYITPLGKKLVDYFSNKLNGINRYHVDIIKKYSFMCLCILSMLYFSYNIEFSKYCSVLVVIFSLFSILLGILFEMQVLDNSHFVNLRISFSSLLKFFKNRMSGEEIQCEERILKDNYKTINGMGI